MRTVLEIIKMSTDFLEGKGVEQARLQAELLVGHALGLRRMQLYLQFERPLQEPELETIRTLLRRRGQREPLQYVLGTTEFFGLTLKVDRRALIPRPETEYLVAVLTERLAPQGRVLDLGTGTGAIALALASHWRDCTVLALEVSPDAVALAAENAQATGLAGRVTVGQSDWFAAVTEGAQFDLIVSNPPYLTAQETNETAPEVRLFEPRQALTPGASGLEAIERMVARAKGFLSPAGVLALETGIAQHEVIAERLVAAGFARQESLPDLTGRPRFVLAWR